jgi:hypothetical protein
MTELAQWDSFYLIVSGAAGALIGLQFVVMTLLAGRSVQPSADAGAAFGTPTIVHFGAVLFLAAILRAPWEEVVPTAILWGLIGFSGLAYGVITIRRMRTQKSYEPEFEDWLFHALLPLAAYLTLGVSAIIAISRARKCLFAVGASALLLLFIGIHNAWDAIVYHVLTNDRKTEGAKRDRDNTAGESDEI